MSWSYNAECSAERDQVRRYIGDVDSSDQQLQDEEIAFALTEESSVRSAAALCCEWIAANFSRLADSAVGDLQISYSQKASQYLTMATKIRRGAALSVSPLVGGISISRKQTVEEDTDRVVPAFDVEMLSHPDSDVVDTRTE